MVKFNIKTLNKSRVDSIMDISIPIVIALFMIIYAIFMIQARTVTIGDTSYCLKGDDSYISIRYAKNLYEGHGLAWNVGQEPVEGYTNFLWVIWIAFLMIFARDPSLLMTVSAVIFHILSVILMYRFLRKKLGSGLVVSTGSALLLACWKPIRIQVRNGLEGPMLLVLFMIAIYLIIDNKEKQRPLMIGAWIAGLLPLVRPNGLYFTCILFLCFVVQYIWPERRNLKGELKKWKWVWAGFFAPFLLLTLFRIVYFGDWLPNTYYLKVTNRPGRISYGYYYVKEFLKHFFGSPFIIPIFIYSLFARKPWLKVLGIGMIGHLFYIVYQGGDAWFAWRFMLLFLPIYLVLLVSLLTPTFSKPISARVFIVGVVMFVLLLGLWPQYQALKKGTLLPKASKSTKSPSAENIRLGLLLKEICHDNAVIADFWAGAVPYYSGLTTIDILGKSDSHIARLPAPRQGLPGHDKFDFDYVLRLKPDIIISRYPLGYSKNEKNLRRKAKGFDPAGAVLLLNPTFNQAYRPIDSILSKRWRGIFVRIDSDKYDLANLAQVEQRLIR